MVLDIMTVFYDCIVICSMLISVVLIYCVGHGFSMADVKTILALTTPNSLTLALPFYTRIDVITLQMCYNMLFATVLFILATKFI